MATDDTSRHLFRPEHHYTGVRMQQSRPLLDSDINESELLDDEGQRAIAVEVIGPHGSADEGFAVGPTVDRINYDFAIHAGSYWLGGLRFQIDDLPLDKPQRLKKQLNWLQQDRGALISPLPEPTGPAARQDLVYLFGWEQSVSAVEDPELLELGLGGPDTTSRIRHMHRVLARAGTPGPADCAVAFQALLASYIGNTHSFDHDNHEIRSAARLTVVLNDLGDGDLCKPALQSGYTGAEVQAIRIQCLKINRFLWSFDAAAPLYRIDVPTGKGTLTITFLTPPRDTAHYPTVGQVIEILPWGAALANGEKVADHLIAPNVGGGVYVRVVKSYDPASRQVQVTEYEATKLDNMIVWLNLRAEPNKYFYARVWNPGDSGDGEVGVPFYPNQNIPLSGTGLVVRFSSYAIVGDHWLVAARPSDPNHVVPWDLLSGAAPHGPRRFLCPLAMIAWTANAFSATVHSCRRTFRPLTRQSGCCSVTVGDGDTSFGDYTSITDALRALPVDMPAKICVLPGVYEERVILQNRTDVCIEGCGPRTILRTPDDNDTSKGLLTITACTRVTVRDLKIEATGQMGVMIFQETDGPLILSRAITLENLDITTTRDSELDEPDIDALWIPTTSAPTPLSTIAAFLADELVIRGCTLAMGSGLSAAANVTIVYCADVVIEDSTITGTNMAWGGIYIGMHSEEIVIEHNTITQGIGHGITLGGVTLDTPSATDHVHIFDPVGRLVLVDGLFGPSVHGSLADTAVPPGGGDPVALSVAEPIHDVQILDNRIQAMGGSGIAVLGFFAFHPEVPDPYRMFTTDDVEIADNHIEDNYRASVIDPPAVGFLDVVGFGGIALADADALRIHDNVITNNGSRHGHAVCGIYLLHGENVVIENNQIRGNVGLSSTQLAGIRAGIALQLVGRRVPSLTESGTIEADHLLPAARVRGNVVAHPIGRALQIYGLGPMLVSGNVLVSQGLLAPYGVSEAHCIEIQNIGQSSELVESMIVPADVGFIPAPPLLYDPGLVADDHLIDGRILFTDNQVRFNPTSVVATDVLFCATRLQSYGDIGVFDNQFLVRFPGDLGTLMYDTVVTAWSTRTSNNRWEDPAWTPDDIVYQTLLSAHTIAAMNITTHNQATRCIVAEVAAGSPAIVATNPIHVNQTYTPCDDEETELGILLETP
jgi:hypothetical protein